LNVAERRRRQNIIEDKPAADHTLSIKNLLQLYSERNMTSFRQKVILLAVKNPENTYYTARGKRRL
jgi:hypothetical protein